MQFVLDHYNYWVIILLMMGGLYILFESQNLIKRLVGLSIFQTSVIVLYVTLGKVASGTAPIYIDTGDHGGDHGEADAGHAATSAGHGVEQHADDAHGVAEHAAEAHGEVHDVDAHDIVEAGADLAKTSAEHVGEAAHAVVEAGVDLHAADAAHPVAEVIYSNPLPHVLMLTAIVVGVATLSVGLALVVRIREAYGTIEMDDVNTADLEVGTREGEKA